MDEKKFEELLIKNNTNLIAEMDKRMDKRFEENNKMIIEEIDKRMDKRFDEVNKRFEQMEQKRIDDNFYFEHTYGEKISIIFDKLQLMEDIKKIEDKENQKYRKKVDHIEDMLMSYDFRISKLEKKVNS